MARVEGSTPNLINGVSRQPSEIRLASQLEESVNQFPTVTRGLVRRNPTMLRGVIPSQKPANSITHLIERDNQERYVVTISPEGIEVHDLEGNQKQVNMPDGMGYLAGADATSLEALSVADHTFILNKKRQVKASSELSPKYPNGGLIHIVQGDYHTDYIVSIDGQVKAHYQTSGGPVSNEHVARETERGTRPRAIAYRLVAGMQPYYPPANPNSIFPIIPGVTPPPSGNATSHSNLQETVGSFMNIWLSNNVIYLERKDGGDFTLDIEVGSGSDKGRAHRLTTTHFNELPRIAPVGFGLKIAGSEETKWDDYYVKFVREQGESQGKWTETVASNIPWALDASTMPHLLVREADGTFTFKQASWAKREVGDLETNPWPSFVGRTIEGMIFFKNRMGFFSGESVSMSRHDDFFNFFQESIITPLDTDMVDVSISYPEISDIHYGIPFMGETVLFTSSIAFRLASNGDLFTPSSVSVEPVLSHTSSAKVKPVVAGDRLYFVNDVPSGAFVHEFIYDESSGVKAAPTITDHVQGYIPHNVHLMVADEDLKFLGLVSSDEPESIYFYKWLWVGQDKVQAAWAKWTIDAPIDAMKILDEDLILITDRGASREILALNLHEAWTDNKTFAIALDRRVTGAGIYNPATDETKFTLPYEAQGVQVVSLNDDTYGLQPTITRYAGAEVYTQGEVTGAYALGFAYESYCLLSRLHHRTTNNQGGYGNAIAGQQLIITHILLQTGMTAYLKVELARDYRKPYLYNFSAALNGTKTALFGQTVLGVIEKTVSIMAKSEDFRLKLSSAGCYPYTLLSYRWTGHVAPLSY